LPNKHFIAQNIANGSVRIEKPDARVALFNFHYSRPPDSVSLNWPLEKAIGLNETGFDGSADATYRIEGWDFLLAGGALYNNLDYSFAVGHERGDFVYPATQPGGGSTALRQQLRLLRDFMDRLDFVRMRPDDRVIAGGVPEGASARVLAEPGKAYAIYLHHGRIVKDGKPRYQVDAGAKTARLRLDLPAGDFDAQWVDTKTGRARPERFQHGGGEREFVSPAYTEDTALRITSRRRSSRP
jgi:hypothetical protein